MEGITNDDLDGYIDKLIDGKLTSRDRWLIVRMIYEKQKRNELCEEIQ